MLNLSGRELLQFPDEPRDGLGRERHFQTGLTLMLLKCSCVEAIRHGEFTTGAFVEPITAWEEPTRLALDVAIHRVLDHIKEEAEHSRSH